MILNLILLWILIFDSWRRKTYWSIITNTMMVAFLKYRSDTGFFPLSIDIKQRNPMISQIKWTAEYLIHMYTLLVTV